jgi:aldehyde dehydrogenase (NAD+)
VGLTSYQDIISKQRQFFSSGKTRSIDFRIEQLNQLKTLIIDNENAIIQALKKDLYKPETEAVINEIILVKKEINLAIKKIKKWSKPLRVSTPFPALWPGKSFIHHEPYGVVLIISPWNYPFLLTMMPLIGAIMAGNCVIIKPSEVAVHSEKIITQLINQHFSLDYIHVVNANSNETQQLLTETFDYIFFTGGENIGKEVMLAAAKHLTPVTLELGGKSPCIIDETIDLDYVARRVVWGKFMNAGQTCIAPDYLLVHASCKEKLIDKLKNVIQEFYGNHPEQSQSFSRIINQKHFDRLCRLLKNGNIVLGGIHDREKLYISPTLIENVNWTDAIMQEEIFGPLLPILTYESIDEVIFTLKKYAHPLALYVFTKNNETEKSIINSLSFGSGCVNDCVVQIANTNMPFGGVGRSGLGAYHGKYSFETFSHRKSIYKKHWLFDLKIIYPPYTSGKLKWLRRILF